MAAFGNPLAGGGGLPGAPAAGPMGANPMAGMLLSALAQRGQGGGSPADQYSQQASELHGADPQMGLRQLQKIYELLGVIFVQTFQSLPNAANQISATMKQLSRAIKEMQQAASTQQVVKRPPIGMSAVEPANLSEGGPVGAGQSTIGGTAGAY